MLLCALCYAGGQQRWCWWWSPLHKAVEEGWSQSALPSVGWALGTLVRTFWDWISKVSLGSPLVGLPFCCGCPSRNSALHVSPANATVILNLLLNLYLSKNKIQNVFFLINTIFENSILAIMA